MANYQAVFAVGDAIVQYLTNSYATAGVGVPCSFKLVSSQDIANENTANLDKTVFFFFICTALRRQNSTAT